MASTPRSGRRVGRLAIDERGDVPMRVGPMLLLSLVLLVLAIVGGKLL